MPLEFSPDGRLLYGVKTVRFSPMSSTYSQSQIRWWDTRTGRLAGSLPANARGLSWGALSRDGRAIFTVNMNNGALQAWSLTSLTPTHSYPGAGGIIPTDNIAVSPDGRSAAIASQNQTLRIWDLRHAPTVALRLPYAGGALSYSRDGCQLALGDRYGNVYVLSPALPAVVIRRFLAHNEGVSALRFSPDGKTLASGGYDGQVRLWNVRTWRPTVTLTAQSGSVREHLTSSLEFSPQGDRLYAGFADGTVRIWYAMPVEDDLKGHIK